MCNQTAAYLFQANHVDNSNHYTMLAIYFVSILNLGVGWLIRTRVRARVCVCLSVCLSLSPLSTLLRSSITLLCYPPVTKVEQSSTNFRQFQAQIAHRHAHSCLVGNVYIISDGILNLMVRWLIRTSQLPYMQAGLSAGTPTCLSVIFGLFTFVRLYTTCYVVTTKLISMTCWFCKNFTSRAWSKTCWFCKALVSENVFSS
jgi:hypothetical protein